MCLVFQDTWYEFRVLAVMQDLISEPSNVAGVSSTGKGFCFLLPPFAWLLWGASALCSAALVGSCITIVVVAGATAFLRLLATLAVNWVRISVPTQLLCL